MREEDPLQSRRRARALTGHRCDTEGRGRRSESEGRTAWLQTGRFRHVPAWRALAEVYRVEGVGGLFKGNMVAVARIAPYSALHFGAFEVYARFLRVAWGAAKATLAVEGGREGDGEDGESKGRDGREGEGEGEGEGNGRGGQGSRAAIHLVAGAGAGATAVAATYPLDLIRTRLAYIIERPGTPPGVRLNPPGPSAPRLGSSSTAAAPAGAAGRDRKTMMGMMRIILAREGVSGLYHGLGPTLLGVLPYAGLKFLVYEGLKAEYPAMVAVGKALKVGEGMEGGNGEGWAWWRMDGRIPLPVLLGFGGVAGLVAQTATYPLDVVRRRMQVQHSTAGRLQRYKGPKVRGKQGRGTSELHPCSRDA